MPTIIQPGYAIIQSAAIQIIPISQAVLSTPFPSETEITAMLARHGIHVTNVERATLPCPPHLIEFARHAKPEVKEALAGFTAQLKLNDHNVPCTIRPCAIHLSRIPPET